MRNSLFFKVFIFITIVSSVILGISFYFLKSYQENNLFENLEIFTYQISNTIKGSLYHAMLTNNRDGIQNIIENVSRQKGIENVFIMDRTGKIIYSPFHEEIGKTLNKDDATCLICHATSKKSEVATIIYETPNRERVFRNVNPIYSAPACYRCHDSKEKIRGVLIIDIPVARFEEQIASNFKKMSFAVLIVFLALGFTLFYTISKLILTPLNTLVSGTKEISSGNLEYKIPLNRTDEMGTLVSSFNSMTNSIRESRNELLKTIEEVKERNNELTTLYKMINEITSVIEIEKLMSVALNIISNILLTEKCYILIFNNKTNTASMNLKTMDSDEIQYSTINFPFTFNDKLDLKALLSSKEFFENLPFYKETNFLYEEKQGIISLPLQSRNAIIGIISAGKGKNEIFSNTEVRIFESLSRSLAVSIQNSLLFEIASTDGLTGLYSKSYFERMLELEYERAKRSKTNLSLIILDIDKFKSINDTYGHQMGDKIIIKISSIIKKSIRIIDVPCRFGGDEFTIILPDTNCGGASQVSERIMNNFKKNLSEDSTETKEVHVTISIGHATYPEDAGDFKELIYKADAALYNAKNSGRNRIASYSNITKQ